MQKGRERDKKKVQRSRKEGGQVQEERRKEGGEERDSTAPFISFVFHAWVDFSFCSSISFSFLSVSGLWFSVQISPLHRSPADQ